MADYHSPTVVRPSIPLAAITSLEHALLCQMFEHESDGDAVYFFASDGPSDTVWLDIADLKTMLDEEPMPSGPVVEMIRTRLAEAGPDETELELDLSDLGDAAIRRVGSAGPSADSGRARDVRPRGRRRPLRLRSAATPPLGRSPGRS